jgi:hypothetical protein
MIQDKIKHEAHATEVYSYTISLSAAPSRIEIKLLTSGKT